jgi:hypothetical protein
MVDRLIAGELLITLKLSLIALRGRQSRVGFFF